MTPYDSITGCGRRRRRVWKMHLRFSKWVRFLFITPWVFLNAARYRRTGWHVEKQDLHIDARLLGQHHNRFLENGLSGELAHHRHDDAGGRARKGTRCVAAISCSRERRPWPLSFFHCLPPHSSSSVASSLSARIGKGFADLHQGRLLAFVRPVRCFAFWRPRASARRAFSFAELPQEIAARRPGIAPAVDREALVINCGFVFVAALQM